MCNIEQYTLVTPHTRFLLINVYNYEITLSKSNQYSFTWNSFLLSSNTIIIFTFINIPDLTCTWIVKTNGYRYIDIHPVCNPRMSIIHILEFLPIQFKLTKMRIKQMKLTYIRKGSRLMDKVRWFGKEKWKNETM